MGHVPSPHPVPPALMDIRENAKVKKAKVNKQKLYYMYLHIALVIPKSIMCHMCAPHLICK